MNPRAKVILISAVFMFLGWTEVAIITDFAHTLTSGAPGRFWIAVTVALMITVAFPLWRLSRPYKGVWQEMVMGSLGFWLISVATELLTRGTEGFGLLWWLSPVSLLVILWVAQEADKQEAERAAAQAAGQ